MLRLLNIGEFCSSQFGPPMSDTLVGCEGGGGKHNMSGNSKIDFIAANFTESLSCADTLSAASSSSKTNNFFIQTGFDCDFCCKIQHPSKSG